ncbi:hypothetical protein [Chryseobacterium sp. P1-3]|nr:hypothetical protein [Chryseobacterium sp. P1-3]
MKKKKLEEIIALTYFGCFLPYQYLQIGFLNFVAVLQTSLM